MATSKSSCTARQLGTYPFPFPSLRSLFPLSSIVPVDSATSLTFPLPLPSTVFPLLTPHLEGTHPYTISPSFLVADTLRSLYLQKSGAYLGDLPWLFSTAGEQLKEAMEERSQQRGPITEHNPHGSTDSGVMRDDEVLVDQG